MEPRTSASPKGEALVELGLHEEEPPHIRAQIVYHTLKGLRNGLDHGTVVGLLQGRIHT